MSVNTINRFFHTQALSAFSKILLSIFACLVLTGCGGGSGEGSSAGDDGEDNHSSTLPAGDKMMLMGHSFFRPFADEMPYHAEQAGVDGHSQSVEFSGGESGSPMSLWEDAEHAPMYKRCCVQGMWTYLA